MSTVISPRCLTIVDVGEPGVRELALDVLADRDVLEQVVGELALVEPVRLPVVDVADAEALGVDLLSHLVLRPQSSGRGQGHAEVAGPLVDPGRAAAGAGAPALQRRALVDADLGDPQVVGDEVVVVLGVGGGGVEQLGEVAGGAAGREREQRARLVDRQAAHLVGDQARLARRDAHVAGLARTIGASVASVCLSPPSPIAPPRRLPEWARKVRVGANSPSLWPTIDSEMNTGTCLRPSWTAIVCPTISGNTVEVRDQVLIICFWFGLVHLSRSASSGAPRRTGPSSSIYPWIVPTSSSSRGGGRGRSARRSALPFLRVR